MLFIIYQPVDAAPRTFIDFWAARYEGYDDDFYEANVCQELTEARILDWFTWKNGIPLSELKRQSIMRNFVAPRGELKQIPQGEAVSTLLSQFEEGGAIWRIFLLHCWQPTPFPIYDQHVHRAMRVLQAGVLEEIPSTDPQKIRTYLNSYMAFHAGFDGIRYRLVDKALWPFGKFLRENNFPREAR